MARGNLTIYDVAPETRAKGAAEARKSLHQMLSNPHLTQLQKADLTERLKWISKWENLNVSEVLPKPTANVEAPRQPTDHAVSVSESLSVEED